MKTFLETRPEVVSVFLKKKFQHEYKQRKRMLWSDLKLVGRDHIKKNPEIILSLGYY